MDKKTVKKKSRSKFERCLLAANFLVGILAACELIAVLDGAWHQVWLEMGVTGYAARVLSAVILTGIFVFLAQCAFNGRPFFEAFCAGLTFAGASSILASVIFCLLPGYEREWFSWYLGGHMAMDGYYAMLGAVLIVAGWMVRFAAEERQ